MHALGQSALHLIHLFLYALDHLSSILAVSHHDNAAYDFALAVFLEHSPPDCRALLHRSYVLNQHGHTASVSINDDTLNALDAFEIAFPAYEVLNVALLQQTPADFVVSAFQRRCDLA